MSTEDAYKVAREVGINLLGSARTVLGSLDKVKRVVKVLGMVNAVESFGEQPKVINGFSDLMVEVFGENGRHARSAVGMGSLPAGIPVEIEMILELNAPSAAAAPKKAARSARSAKKNPEAPPLGFLWGRGAPSDQSSGGSTAALRDPRAVPGEKLAVHQVHPPSRTAGGGIRGEGGLGGRGGSGRARPGAGLTSASVPRPRPA